MALKVGQKVIIKRLDALVGRVIGPRPGDSGLPEEETHYRVQICEAEPRFYLFTDLEPVEQPGASVRLEMYSREWLEELKRFGAFGARVLANPNDRNLVRQWAESGTKLGFVSPFE